ncbi:MAG: M20/M25/M40 family metallo-hydrolase [Planctomycetes bacterium]|nr:M20/M25/M40 family metallo-hydrolase [Planctomycetota bacterium]
MNWLGTGCVLLAFSLSLAGQEAPPGPAVPPPSPEVRAEDLRRHVEFLASDRLQGRSTGSPEAMEAARYLALELQRYGVEPAGEEGTYFQKVPIGRTEFLEIPKLAWWDAAGVRLEGRAGVDFDLVDGGSEARELSVVYVAAAAEIPAPADPALALVLLAESAAERVAWLKAAGIPDGGGFGLVVHLGAKDAGNRPMERPPRPRAKIAGPTPRISARGDLRKALAERRVTRFSFSAPVRTEVREAANVVGRLRGGGSKERADLAQEIIELSAHYDHLPPRQGAEGEDVIFNGADDDASGCAVVLELAENLAHGPRPARTLLFFFATGEEIGLVGTNYSLEHPLVPLDQIVLDVNFEMLGRPDTLLSAPARMWLTGYERSDLGDELARLGLPVVADPRPEQQFFQRSDNYALALRGVVAQTLSSYGMHTDYHTVRDEAATLDWVHMEACARGALSGVRAIADGSFRPRWREGLDPSKPRARSGGAKPPSEPPPEKPKPAGG